MKHANQPTAEDLACLRVGTNSQNRENLKGPTAANQLGFLGVTNHRRLFRSAIRVAGKKMELGLFKTPEEAHAEYLAKKREHHSFNTL